MSKFGFGMVCCVLGWLTGCTAASQPLNSLEVHRSVDQSVQPLPKPPSLVNPQQPVPSIGPSRSSAGDMMPHKVESEQQVDPSKLRQTQSGN